MKFWTAFRAGGSYMVPYHSYSRRGSARRVVLHHWFHATDPDGRRGPPEPDISGYDSSDGTGYNDIMLVLEGASPEELLALNNAVVYSAEQYYDLCVEADRQEAARRDSYRSNHVETFGLSRSAHIAITPYAHKCASDNIEEHRGCRNTSVSENMYPDGSITVIKNGAITSAPCEECKWVLRRGIGECSFPDKRCISNVFSESDRITLPPMDLYIPLKKCSRPYPFDPHTPKTIRYTEVSPGHVLESTSRCHDAAVFTRRMRKAICDNCAMRSRGQAPGCIGNGDPDKDCGGPIFAYEFPEPDALTRTFIHLNNRVLSRSEFLDECSPGGLLSTLDNVNIPNWRDPADLMIGYYDKIHETVRVFNNRRKKTNVSIDVPVNDMLAYMAKYDHKLPELSKEMSDLERAVCFVLDSGAARCEWGIRSGWGNASSCADFVMCHRQVHARAETYTFSNAFSSYVHTTDVTNVGRIFELLYGLRRQTDFIATQHGCSVMCRRRALMKVFKDGKCKDDVNAVRKFTEECAGLAAGAPVPPLPNVK